MSLTGDILPTPRTSFAVPAPVLPLQQTPTAAPALVAGFVSLEKVQEDDDYDLESMDASPPMSPVLYKGNLIIPPLDPTQQNYAPTALPTSVKEFIMLYGDDEFAVDLLGLHSLSFPFEDQLVYATFWQGVYISHHLCKVLEQNMVAKGQTSLTFARELLLDLLSCSSKDGVFDSVCHNSVKGFQQRTEDGTLVAAWCLHCPLCSAFISCSSFLNVQTHIMLHQCTDVLDGNRSCLDSYFDCKLACTKASIEWPCSLESSSILEFSLESSQSVLETWEVLELFDLFLSPSCFERLFVKSPFSAAFAFSLVFVWKYCFENHFGPYLKESRIAVGVTPVKSKRKKSRK